MGYIVKNTTLPNFLDLLFPHSCRCCGRIGSPLCDCCKKYILDNYSSLCPNCKVKTKNGQCTTCRTLPPVFSLGKREGILNLLIHEYKYHSNRRLARTFAELLDTRMPTIDQPCFIVPLPTTNNHIRMRGFDHTHQIAKHFARIRHYQVQKLLLRNNNTTQVGQTQKVRIAQAQTAYIANPYLKINPSATYILFDDVWTTGASMQNAAKKLQQAGAKHIIIALLAISCLD